MAFLMKSNVINVGYSFGSQSFYGKRRLCTAFKAKDESHIYQVGGRRRRNFEAETVRSCAVVFGL